jgi:hypothetical protein
VAIRCHFHPKDRRAVVGEAMDDRASRHIRVDDGVIPGPEKACWPSGPTIALKMRPVYPWAAWASRHAWAG